jgi:hypothetical protein
LIALFFVSAAIVACTKEKVACQNNTELTDQHHLVDLALLNQAAEFNDTLAKYPQLQVYRVVNDPYLIGIHCHVFYKGLKVFSDQYSLFKSKSDNSVFSISNFIVDTVAFSLTPPLPYTSAIDIATQEMDYSNTCISYRLGIFDLNSGKGAATKEYKLVWKIEGENGYPYAVLDANNGEVYRAHDGIIN